MLRISLIYTFVLGILFFTSYANASYYDRTVKNSKILITKEFLEYIKASSEDILWFEKTFMDKPAYLSDVIRQLRKEKSTLCLITLLFVELKLSGIAENWYENKNIEYVCHYVNGEKHGAYKGYYKNGKRHYSFPYKNGKPNGTWKVWDKNGRNHIIKYKDGYIIYNKDIQSRVYAPNGNVNQNSSNDNSGGVIEQ